MELNLQPIELEGVSKERPLIIAGPCSAETEEQVISTATQLANKGIKIFRAGIWKPRTKPGGFEGTGVDGRMSKSRYRHLVDRSTYHCQPVCRTGNS